MGDSTDALDLTIPDQSGGLPRSGARQNRQRDPLTGMFGIDAMLADIELALKKNKRQALAATLALLQLDNFYEIRTWVGKSEANLLLSDIARLIQDSLPRSVILYRCEHYEFAALLFNEASLNARLVTDRVKTAMLSAVSGAIPPQLELKCGVGLASLEQKIPSAEVLLARARHNLCRSRYVSDSQLQVAALSSREPQLALKKVQQGLQEGQFRLNYQATVNLKEDSLKHFEVRCSLPSLQKKLPTANLFELAVRNAMGELIDRWVLRRTIQLLLKRQQAELRMTVNLTLNSLVSPEFIDWLAAELETAPALGDQLVLQLSEIDILIAQHHIGAFSQRINSLNCKLSISHFGCTPEPFRYLTLLRAHYVKLDVSLLEKINADQARRERLNKTVAECHGRGLRVIAGMVDSVNSIPSLYRARVNLVQGHCMHAPRHDPEFEFYKEIALTLH